jgi:hypothetical protein
MGYESFTDVLLPVAAVYRRILWDNTHDGLVWTGEEAIMGYFEI